MGMRTTGAAVALAAVVGVLGGGCPSAKPPPPGWSGSVPSSAGQNAIGAMAGKTFTDTAKAFGGGDWTCDQWYVPGGGPSIRITQGTITKAIPIETDGDVADFVARVTGAAPPGIAGPMSPAYARAIGR